MFEQLVPALYSLDFDLIEDPRRVAACKVAAVLALFDI